MSESTLFRKILRRLRAKIIGSVPIVVGALVLVAILSVITYLVVPFLPENYQQILQQVQRGDWATSRQSLARLFDSYGPARVYAFLAFQVLQVLAAPIPGQLLGLLGGYLFGFWYGLLITMLGLTVGSAIAMGLSRLFGNYVARKLVPPAVLAKFDYLIDHGGLWNFFLLFLLPALPDDAICFIAGLTRIKLWKLLLVSVLGRLPGMAVLTFVGTSVGGNMAIANVVLGVAMIAAFALWLFSEEIEAFFSRLSKRQSNPTVGEKP